MFEEIKDVELVEVNGGGVEADFDGSGRPIGRGY